MKKSTFLFILLSILVSCQKEEIERDDCFILNSTGLLHLSSSIYNNFPETTLPAAGELPSEEYLEVPPAGNQGSQGSCVAWAVAYGLKSYQIKQFNPSLSWESILCSPSFVYNQIKIGDCNSGAYIHDALNLLQNKGVCHLSEMLYDPNNCSALPNSTQLQLARNHKFLKWERLRINLASVKNAIHSGFPVVIAIQLDCNINETLPDNEGRYIWNKSNDYCGSYHAMLVYGYNENIKAFKVLNSWGENWKNDGSIWISYDMFLRRVDQAYIASSNDSISNRSGWEKKSNFPGSPRNDAVGFSINGSGYFGTGCQYLSFGNFACLDDFYQYVPISDSWIQKEKFPGGKRSQCFGFSIGNKGYIGGGYSIDNGIWMAHKDMYQFDSEKGSWVKVADYIGDINPYMCFFSSNNGGFIFDGLVLYKFNPTLNEWTSLGSFEDEFRRDAIGLVFDNKCFIGLGYYNKGTYSGESANTFYYFDLNTANWHKYTSLDWKVRRGLSYFSFQNKLYFGFGNESLNDNSGLMADFWEFDISSKSLTKLPNFPSSSGYKEGFSISSNFYLGLGFDGTFPSEFWCLSYINQ